MRSLFLIYKALANCKNAGMTIASIPQFSVVTMIPITRFAAVRVLHVGTVLNAGFAEARSRIVRDRARLKKRASISPKTPPHVGSMLMYSLLSQHIARNKVRFRYSRRSDSSQIDRHQACLSRCTALRSKH